MRLSFLYAALIPAISLCAGAGWAQTAAGSQSELMQRAAQLRAQWAEKVARGQAPAKAVEPAFTGGQILTPTVNVEVAPGQAAASFSIDLGTVGVDFIQTALVSPSGARYIYTNLVVPPYPPGLKKFTIKTLLGGPPLGSGFNLYSEPGTWSITLSIVSADGTFISYSPAQIASLFPQGSTVRVTNPGTPDVSAPVAHKGAILTPTVSLSSADPSVVVKLSASDDVSGVSNGSVSFLSPGTTTNFFSVGVNKALPTKSANLVMAASLGTSTATGTYSITNFSLCDYAGNCLFDSNPTDISAHFGTTTVEVTP